MFLRKPTIIIILILLSVTLIPGTIIQDWLGDNFSFEMYCTDCDCGHEASKCTCDHGISFTCASTLKITLSIPMFVFEGTFQCRNQYIHTAGPDLLPVQKNIPVSKIFIASIYKPPKTS